jgi:hypothetical protein
MAPFPADEEKPAGFRLGPDGRREVTLRIVGSDTSITRTTYSKPEGVPTPPLDAWPKRLLHNQKLILEAFQERMKNPHLFTQNHTCQLDAE